MKKCPFCNYQKMKQEGIIFETDNFFFVRDLYPAWDGHCLLITKKHIRTEKEIKQKQEFQKACDKAWKWVSKNYSNPITFVHPPNLQTVYHYHRHYIPSKNLPREYVKKVIKEGIKRF